MKGSEEKRSSATIQEAIRIRVAAYLNSGTGTQKAASDIFALSLSAVKKIWKRFKLQGIEGLKAHKRGPKQSTSRLNASQVQQLTRDIRQDTPERYGLPYTLWTATAVRELIKKRPG